MSVLLEDTNNEYFTKSAIQAGASAIVVGIWVRARAVTDAQYIVSYDYNSTGWGVFLDSDRYLSIRDYNVGAITNSTTTQLTLDTWYYVWVRVPGTGAQTCSVYLNGSTGVEVDATVTTSTGGAPTFYLGRGRYNATDCWDGDLVGAKVWEVDRAASNADTEKACGNAVDDTNLLAEYKLNTTPWTEDTFGSLDLTATGTLSQGAADPGGYSVTCGAGSAVPVIIQQML